jgi:hypothetical protein
MWKEYKFQLASLLGLIIIMVFLVIFQSSLTYPGGKYYNTPSPSPKPSPSPSPAACPSSGGYKVTLAWDPNSDPVDGYYIYLSTISGNYSTLNRTDVGNVTNYTLSGLSEGVRYYSVVTAYADSLESDYSIEISFQYSPSLSISCNGTAINITYSRIPGGSATYTVQEASSISGPWTDVSTSTTTTVTKPDGMLDVTVGVTGVSAGTKFFRVSISFTSVDPGSL